MKRWFSVETGRRACRRRTKPHYAHTRRVNMYWGGGSTARVMHTAAAVCVKASTRAERVLSYIDLVCLIYILIEVSNVFLLRMGRIRITPENSSQNNNKKLFCIKYMPSYSQEYDVNLIRRNIVLIKKG